MNPAGSSLMRASAEKRDGWGPLRMAQILNKDGTVEQTLSLDDKYNVVASAQGGTYGVPPGAPEGFAKGPSKRAEELAEEFHEKFEGDKDFSNRMVVRPYAEGQVGGGLKHSRDSTGVQCELFSCGFQFSLSIWLSNNYSSLFSISAHRRRQGSAIETAEEQ